MASPNALAQGSSLANQTPRKESGSRDSFLSSPTTTLAEREVLMRRPRSLEDELNELAMEEDEEAAATESTTPRPTVRIPKPPATTPPPPASAPVSRSAFPAWDPVFPLPASRYYSRKMRPLGWVRTLMLFVVLVMMLVSLSKGAYQGWIDANPIFFNGGTAPIDEMDFTNSTYCVDLPAPIETQCTIGWMVPNPVIWVPFVVHIIAVGWVSLFSCRKVAEERKGWPVKPLRVLAACQAMLLYLYIFTAGSWLAAMRATWAVGVYGLLYIASSVVLLCLTADF